MLATVRSLTLLGIEPIALSIEVDLGNGLPGIHTVGLPDAAVRESAERVRAALRHTGLQVPARRITISLAPADLRKQGSALDLPIALGIVVAAGQVSGERLDRMLVSGELGLDGAVRAIRGVLPATLLARRLGLEEVIVPSANAGEALAVGGPRVHAVRSLAEALAALRGERDPDRVPRAVPGPEPSLPGPDLRDVRGQAHARRALEVAAAGGHHLLFIGPPGCGKTMLARRLPGILPPLQPEEAIEVSGIYSAAGLLRDGRLMRGRPFRAPHHTISGIGLVGGGRGPRPGEITLAHQGVLFLDELPEFGRATLDVLRQPLEQGEVIITRENRTLLFPARAALLAAMNPCACGQWGTADRACSCTPAMLAKHRARVSGPLLDRFDMQINVPAVRPRDLAGAPQGEESAAVAARVAAARRVQEARFGSAPRTNASMATEDIRRHADPGEEGRRLIALALRRLGLSARGLDSMLRVARTIADLAGSGSLEPAHLAEAIQYRSLDRLSTGDPTRDLTAPAAGVY